MPRSETNHPRLLVWSLVLGFLITLPVAVSASPGPSDGVASRQSVEHGVANEAMRLMARAVDSFELCVDRIPGLDVDVSFRMPDMVFDYVYSAPAGNVSDLTGGKAHAACLRRHLGSIEYAWADAYPGPWASDEVDALLRDVSECLERSGYRNVPTNRSDMAEELRNNPEPVGRCFDIENPRP